MEWVEGTSLKQALPLLPHDASGGLTTQMVAAVGNAVLRALLMTQGLVNPVIHRDLSPANIMFRTTSRTLEQQIADCSFDPCLIDMGSATMALGDDTITRRADIWRFATPAYAAPEMLTQDIEGIAALRRSPAIDVYALSSILYQLYSGRKPFDFESTDAAATGSFYLVKTKTKPAPLEPRCEGDEALVQIIMKGLSVEQCDRPYRAADARGALGIPHRRRIRGPRGRGQMTPQLTSTPVRTLRSTSPASARERSWSRPGTMP